MALLTGLFSLLSLSVKRWLYSMVTFTLVYNRIIKVWVPPPDGSSLAYLDGWLRSLFLPGDREILASCQLSFFIKHLNLDWRARKRESGSMPESMHYCLNICTLPKFMFWNLNVKVLRVTRRYWGGLLRSWRWNPHEWGLSPTPPHQKKISFTTSTTWEHGKKAASMGLHQMYNLLGTWSWISQPPELWEMLVTQLVLFGYSSSNRIRQ